MNDRYHSRAFVRLGKQTTGVMADKNEINKARRNRELSNEEIREVAKILFIQTELSQKEIAIKTGCNEHMVGRWARQHGWYKLKLSEQSIWEVSKFKLLERYQQAIEANEPVEMIEKIRKEIEALPSTNPKPQMAVKVLKDFLSFIMIRDVEFAKTCLQYQDDFIKTHYF